MPLTRVLLALGPGAVLGVLLAIGTIVPGANWGSTGFVRPAGAASAAPMASYLREVNPLLGRYDLARKEGSRLLTQRDSDPLLGATDSWRQSFGKVAAEHAALLLQVQSLTPPPAAAAAQQCLSEGFRLTATGEALLAEAFGVEGHQAYFLSAHGNWDLNLGDRAVARCRTLLSAIKP